ncbi:hypothetical protein C8R45DRAFT_1080593 [Mycena sanguinolenta]|nr:hypothetical protein C8R45DRAFT_1080593 [Mycena sanguinolenta]
MSKQDRAFVLAVCKAPTNLSYEAFEKKFTSIVDGLLALPISQEKFLKFDIIFQTEVFDEHLKALGFPKTPPGAVVTAECATEADFLEMLKVPEFANIVQEGRKTLYGNNPPVDAFMADVKTHIDRPASSRTLLVGAVPYLGDAPDSFRQAIGNFGDKLATLPIAQKLVKYSMWNSFPNNAIATPLNALGFPTSITGAVYMIETESESTMIEVLTDSATKQYMADTIREFSIGYGSLFFAAKVVNKVNK